MSNPAGASNALAVLRYIACVLAVWKSHLSVFDIWQARYFSTIFSLRFVNLSKTTISMRNVVEEAGIEGKIHVNIVCRGCGARHSQPAILLTQERCYSLFFCDP